MRGLGDMESAVMEHIRSYDRPVSVRDVLETLEPAKPRAYLYASAASHESYSAQIMQQALAQGGSQAMTLVHFLDRLTPEEHDTLTAAFCVLNNEDATE
jgi:predicted transcriptional regulator